MNLPDEANQLPGLQVQLDRLVYHYEDDHEEAGGHVWIYFLTIRNLSDRAVQLLARKWVIQEEDGQTSVVEGEGIVNEKPSLSPGEQFSYNSYHVLPGNGVANGSFHGRDEFGEHIWTRIPTMELHIPEIEEQES